MLNKSQSSRVDDSLMKLFPKVTVVKIGKRQQSFDHFLVHKCQDMFTEDICNVQLIELFDEKDTTLDTRSAKNSRKRIESFNMR